MIMPAGNGLGQYSRYGSSWTGSNHQPGDNRPHTPVAKPVLQAQRGKARTAVARKTHQQALLTSQMQAQTPALEQLEAGI